MLRRVMLVLVATATAAGLLATPTATAGLGERLTPGAA